MLKLVKLFSYPNYLDDATSLFLRAFPEDERPPVEIIYDVAKREQVIHHILLDGDKFAGLAFVAVFPTYYYLYFLAVEDKERGKGYGHFILNELSKLYDDKPTLILAESLNEPSDNKVQREARMSFYHHSGFVNLDYGSEEFGVKYDALSRGGYVSFEDYYDGMSSLWGPELAKQGIKRL